MTQYRTRPVDVETIHWLGEENCAEVFAFLGLDHSNDETDHSLIYVDGISNVWEAEPGDWIVRFPDGDRRAFSPADFEARFRAVPDESAGDRLAEIRERYAKGDLDTLELLLDCLGVGINVLDHRTKARDNWIADIKRYQADHLMLLGEVESLTDMYAAQLRLTGYVSTHAEQYATERDAAWEIARCLRRMYAPLHDPHGYLAAALGLDELPAWLVKGY